ncbi:ty3-gypsy retrotransposon protein [Tanacetum coccineum]
MEMKANRSRRDVEFNKGDMVFVKLQPYRQVTLAKRLSNKLAKRYYGPFEVLEHVEKVAYRHPVEQPLSICDSRVVLCDGLPRRQVLVQWVGSTPEEATWEWLTDFQVAYPNYHLEEKVHSEGEENDTMTMEAVEGRVRGKRVTTIPEWHKDYVMR